MVWEGGRKRRGFWKGGTISSKVKELRGGREKNIVKKKRLVENGESEKRKKEEKRTATGITRSRSVLIIYMGVAHLDPVLFAPFFNYTCV